MKVEGEASLSPEPAAVSEKATWALVAGLAMVGFALRAVHLFAVSPHVDEYSTIWAAQQIVQRGLPLLPSGFIYLQGVLFSYLEAPFLYLFGFSEPVARLPSLVLSVASIPLAYLLGKRIFSPYVGFLTAVLLALSPEAIIWGGRARMYATQGFLVLLALYCLEQGVAEKDGRHWRYLFAFSFIGALLSQTVTVLLFPALVLALLVWKGWRWFLRPGVALLLGLTGLGTVGAVGLNAIGGPVAEAARRPFLDPSLYWGYKSSLSFRWFFWSSPRLLLSALFILGFIYLSREFLRAWSGGWAERTTAFEAQNARLISLYALFSFTMFQMIFLVGETWRRHRYITMLLPIYFLIAAAVATRGLTALERRAPAHARGWIGRGGRALIAVTAVALFLPGAWAAATQPQPGYDQAFRYLRDHWQPGDAVSTPLPAISGVYLGGCDYYALQQGYEAYLMCKDDLWLDRWTGAPLLNSVRQLEEVLSQGRRVWFVVDDLRLREGYNPDFVRYVEERMRPAHRAREVTAFLAGPSAPPAPFHVRQANFAGRIELVGYSLEAERAQPGDVVGLSLFWRSPRPPGQDYTVTLRLSDQEGRQVWQEDGPPVDGLFPTSRWSAGTEIWDARQVMMPEGIAAGRYRLEIGLYYPSTLKRLAIVGADGGSARESLILDYVQVPGGKELMPQHPLMVLLGEYLTLLGYDLEPASVQAGESLHLNLYWRARGEMEEDYSVFVHLLGEDGRIWGQADGEPQGGFYPTSFWDEGDIVVDERELAIRPDAPPGRYRLAVGMYLLSTGQRLAIAGEEGDQVVLGQVWVSGMLE